MNIKLWFQTFVIMTILFQDNVTVYEITRSWNTPKEKFKKIKVTATIFITYILRN